MSAEWAYELTGKGGRAEDLPRPLGGLLRRRAARCGRPPVQYRQGGRQHGSTSDVACYAGACLLAGGHR
ncbi:hypothetical protein GCM10010440_06650 [Kitasatospora cinereorecta]